MAPQPNEKKWITWSQVDTATAWNKQACNAAVRCVQARWSWINERSNNSAPLPVWAVCAVDDRCNPMWWLMCKQHSNTRHKCEGKMSQLLRLFEWFQVNLVAQLPSGCVRWSMLFGCWGCWGSVGSFFLAVLTCAGQFEDVSVVLWVDRVVCGGFHSILCCCFLKRCFKLKKVVSVCCNWLKIASCQFGLSYGVVWCFRLFQVVSRCSASFGWIFFDLFALLCLCCVHEGCKSGVLFWVFFCCCWLLHVVSVVSFV